MSDGVCVKRIVSLPFRSLMTISPYQLSRYVPAYFAAGSDGFDAASRDTHSGTALYFAAETLVAAGKLQDAEGFLRQSLEREPDSAATLYQLARLMAHRGDAGEAGTLLVRFAKNAPPNLAQMALQDQLFSEAPPDSPIRRGLDAIRASAQEPPPARP